MNFTALEQLIKFLSPNKIGQIDQPFGKTSYKNSLNNKLYYGIADGKLKSKEDALTQLNISPQKFKDSKNYLLKKVINTLFLIQSPANNSDLNKSYVYCAKWTAAAQLLKGFGISKASAAVAKRAFDKALRFQHTEFIVPTASILQYHTGVVLGDNRQYAFYTEVLENSIVTLQAETKAQTLHNNYLLQSAKSRSKEKLDIKPLKESVEIVKRLNQQNDSYKIQRIFFLLSLKEKEFLNDWVGIQSICKETIEYFKQNNQSMPIGMQLLASINLLNVSLYLQDWISAKQELNNCLALVPKDSYNYFVILNYQVILGFHSQQYQLVKAAIGLTENKLSKMPAVLQEQWLIIQAYYHLLCNYGIIQVEPIKFKLNKFLNEVPIFTKDRQGNRIHLLTLQILFLLHQKKYNQIIDRIEPNQNFIQRNIRKDQFFRIHCFLKALQQLSAGGFHPAAVKRKAQPFLNKMKTMPLVESKQESIELELVPFEILWEMALGKVRALYKR